MKSKGSIAQRALKMILRRKISVKGGKNDESDDATGFVSDFGGQSASVFGAQFEFCTVWLCRLVPGQSPICYGRPVLDYSLYPGS